MAITRRTWTDDSGNLISGTILNNAELQRIYDDVEATSPAAFGCSVYNSSQQTISASVATAITFDSEDFDNGAIHSTSANTSRGTVPTGGSGIWHAIGSVSFAPNATGYRQIDLRKNGTSILDSVTVPSNTAGSPTGRFQVSTYVSLTTADYLEVLATQNTTSSLVTGSPTAGLQNRLVMVRVG